MVFRSFDTCSFSSRASLSFFWDSSLSFSWSAGSKQQALFLKKHFQKNKSQTATPRVVILPIICAIMSSNSAMIFLQENNSCQKFDNTESEWQEKKNTNHSISPHFLTIFKQLFIFCTPLSLFFCCLCERINTVRRFSLSNHWVILGDLLNLMGDISVLVSKHILLLAPWRWLCPCLSGCT